jgi:SAM-dependent methyltransferase
VDVRSLPLRAARAALRALSPGGASPLYQRATADAPDFIKFPCHPPRISRLEQLMIRAKSGRMTCTVCGGFTRFRIEHDNLRETCVCASCGATNRHRQLAYVLCAALARQHGKPVAALPSIADAWPAVAIYNTEVRGPTHARLASLPAYQASEYFGPEHQSGERVSGVMHQDLQQLSFADEQFDVVLSSDVFEHIPDPYRAHAEVNRVLKKGGRHIFTVPFYADGHLDETRARLGALGIEHLLPPIYHHDPQTGKDDVLVYTIFGLEMLVRLKRIGFDTALYQLSAPWLGILGSNALVFEAVKSQT